MLLSLHCVCLFVIIQMVIEISFYDLLDPVYGKSSVLSVYVRLHARFAPVP